MPDSFEPSQPRSRTARVRRFRGAAPHGLLLLPLLLVVNGGCLSPIFDGSDNFLLNPDVQASDHDVLMPSMRVSWEGGSGARARQVGVYEAFVAPGSPPASSSAGLEAPTTNAVLADPTPSEEVPPPRRRRSVLPIYGVEAEYAVGVGARDNRPTPGDVLYDGVGLIGIPELRFDHDLHVATLGAHGGMRVKDFFALEGLAGVSVAALRLRLENATQRVTDTGVSVGGHVGARVTLSPHPVFDLLAEAKLHMMNGVKTKRRFVFVPTALLAGQLHLSRNVSAFAGYRWWRYRENIGSGSDIDDLSMEGPTMGLSIRF